MTFASSQVVNNKLLQYSPQKLVCLQRSEIETDGLGVVLEEG